ncbi:Rrf2 family transcriptional regulator [Staphylococcus hominis]|uniref:cysteine metabolism transcriptional regulator CymR n=2 Tax=Staphylococcus hominis TaxID=1290 RepID=UPI00158AADE8|nr:Rrf2 family transcriptional regulator [Staphylococcus hominis]QKW67062.1 Rrf2 family transcriptional regulator [Staphylococcus hominis]
MKISTKGRYGLTLMISLAKRKREGQGCVSLKTIAEENHLSDLYLEQLVGPLRNAGLIRSIRGAKGGYQLRVPSEEISAGDIIRLLEGPITIVESIDSEPPAQKELWLRMRDAVREVLDNTTLKYLADFVESDNDLDGYMFYI